MLFYRLYFDKITFLLRTYYSKIYDRNSSEGFITQLQLMINTTIIQIYQVTYSLLHPRLLCTFYLLYIAIVQDMSLYGSIFVTIQDAKTPKQLA